MILKYLIGIVIVSFIITSFAFMYNDMADKYNVSHDLNKYEAYNKINEMNTLTSTIRTNVKGEDVRGTNYDEQDKTSNLIIGSWNSLKLTWNSWSTTNALIEAARNDLKSTVTSNSSSSSVSNTDGASRVDFLYTTAIVIIVLIFSFAIINAIMKTEL